MEIEPAPQLGGDEVLRNDGYGYGRRRFRTSSIWSPHLRLDRRSTRQSRWEAPSISWSTEPGVFGRRNRQIFLFILGFVFPFAWIIAAFLPLPPKPIFQMQERDGSGFAFEGELRDALRPMDEARWESARRWRNINRAMSVVGLLIIGAIVSIPPNVSSRTKLI